MICRSGANAFLAHPSATESFHAVRPIELLYVANLISRHDEGARQELVFRCAVARWTYGKTVEVHWAGEDGRWRVLPAAWVCGLGPGRELWEARAVFQGGEHASLPGDIRFAVCCRMAGGEHWDNNGGADHEINADSGVRLFGGRTLLHLDYRPQLEPAADHLAIEACWSGGGSGRVFVRWSTDGWRSVQDTPCYFRRRHWSGALGSTARNPNRYGSSIWITQLGIGEAGHVEYAIGCETEAGVAWDNNFGANYVARRDRLRVLTLNLHCGQEADQDAKLSLIARAIRELEVDIVCFQEVAEPWNDGRGQAEANTARAIRARIGRPFHLHQDWSHLGFGRFREGCAVLSRHPFLRTDSGYMSVSQDPFSIHSRRVVLARIDVPHLGPVNVFSTHLSWWSDGFREQFGRLRQWADEQHDAGTAATLLCGDFNVPAHSAGHELATGDGHFSDQFLQARLQQQHEDGAGPAPSGRERPEPDDGRIDFLFAHRASRLRAVAARELFTDADYGRVSDHPGYLVEFVPI